MKSTYKRNGTINLFAALNVATGVVNTKTTGTKMHTPLHVRSITTLLPPKEAIKVQIYQYLDRHPLQKATEENANFKTHPSVCHPWRK